MLGIKRPKPNSLGTGMARKAADAAKVRRETLESALKEVSGRPNVGSKKPKQR